MSSIDSKSHSCKNPIQSTIHQPLQIRTNKHRCFVFCLGHTSLTCVPGIGKKNEYLLNQSGIRDLSALYRKYRAIDNMQHFEDWLENEIGFTSYQAKMTACGIGSKLGEIKEINTGLTPICCPSKERRGEKQRVLSKDRDVKKRNRSIQSENEEDKEESKKRKMENIKLEKLSPSLNRDRTEPKEESFLSTMSNDSINKKETIFSPNTNQALSSSKEKLPNKLSNDYLTGVKSPENLGIARRPPSMKNKDQSDLSSSPNQRSFEEKYKSNEVSQTKPRKLYSSLMMDETTRDDINSPEPTEQSASKKIVSSVSTPFKKNQTHNNTDKTSSTVESPSVSPATNSGQQEKNETPAENSSLIRSSSTPQSDLSHVSKKVKSTKANISISSEQIPSSQDKKPVSHVNPNDFSNDKSLLTDKTTKSNSPKTEKLNEIFNLTRQKLQPTLDALQDKKDKLLSAAKHSTDASVRDKQPIIHTPQSKSTSPLDTNILSTTTKREHQLQTENNTKSTPAIERSSGMLPPATPAVFPTESKPVDESNISDAMELTSENNRTSGMDQRTPPVTFSDNSLTTLNASNSKPTDKWQESTPNRSDLSLNKLQEEELQKEASKTVSEILKQAAHTVHDNIQPPTMDSILPTKIKSKEVPSVQIPTVDTKNHPDTVQSLTSPYKRIPLVEQPAISVDKNNKDDQSQQLPGQDSLIQKNFSPPVSDRLKQTSTKTSSPSRTDQFSHDETSIKPNSNEKLQSAQVQQELNNISSTPHPSDNVTNNPKLLSLNAYNKSVKPSSLASTQMYNDRLQHEQPTSTARLPTTIDVSPTTNKSSDLLGMKLSKEKKSLSALSSLSDSNQSTNRIPSSMENLHSTSSNINGFGEEIELEMNHDAIPSNPLEKHDQSPLAGPTDHTKSESIPSVLTASPTNTAQSPIEHGQQPSSTDATVFKHSIKEKPDVSIIPSNRINQLLHSQSLKDTQRTNKHVSEIENSEPQSRSSPSFPTPCHALWDNISNEKLLSPQKNHRFNFHKRNQVDQSEISFPKETNQHDHNQNHYSSTTLFPHLTRQEHLKERKILDEHILYIKRLKTAHKQ